MNIIVSSKDHVSDLSDLSFCEKFNISLNRARLHGKKGLSQSEFARHVNVSESSISKAKNGSKTSETRARKEMQRLIDKVLQ